jgi:hypothetical protein
MENQTLTSNDLQYILNVLEQQITMIQLTCDRPFESQSYNNIMGMKKRVVNQLLQSYDNE